MATYLFSVIPAMGHVNPTLPFADELRRRGHRVVYATGTDLQKSIEAAGLEFVSAGPAGIESYQSEYIQKMLKYQGLRSNYWFYRGLIDYAEKTVPELRPVVEAVKPDAMVVDCITHGGSLTAELCGVPWATSHPLAGLIPSADAPPFTSWGLPPTENPLVQTVYDVVRWGQNRFFRLFDGEFNRLRASLGLKPMRACVACGTLSPYLILMQTCEGFEYRRSDWPPQAHLIGPAPWGKSLVDDAAFAWIDELPADKPVVYATLGTVQVFRSLKFFSIVIDALKDVDCRVVMSVGHKVDINEFSGAPAHFRFERFTPHAKMLPRTTAVIHHGGQGIAQDSIYHGLPAVVVPVSQDLYEIARRCTSAGTALSIPYPRLSAPRLRRAVETILGKPSYKDNALRLQQVYLQTDAAVTGADLLEQLAATCAPVLRTAPAA